MSRDFRIALLLSVLAAVVVSGCGRALPTSPEPASGATGVRSQAPAPGASLIDPGDLLPITNVTDPLFVTDPDQPVLPGPLRYLQVATSLVSPLAPKTIRGGSWRLDVPVGAVALPKLLSIATASDGSLRVEFGPEGTKFLVPVTVTVDYAGTALDPASPSYQKGLVPVFLYFDPAQGKWVEQPSVNDTARKQLRAKLAHFSQYGVGGRAGW